MHEKNFLTIAKRAVTAHLINGKTIKLRDDNRSFVKTEFNAEKEFLLAVVIELSNKT